MHKLLRVAIFAMFTMFGSGCAAMVSFIEWFPSDPAQSYHRYEYCPNCDTYNYGGSHYCPGHKDHPRGYTY